jgi:hypothetical protein
MICSKYIKHIIIVEISDAKGEYMQGQPHPHPLKTLSNW